ncbi:hypothetical protein AUC68_04740 [Methyloceanibacter methanicus]|uniref:Uncharacterized protein n=1 Tax=Methyloceanibacter methanicus TaxID=1774968 RepID=A0A1E3W0G0_9HYPH|nr:hypothetical protein [Methyloceanibacter methanicus]ODR99305.1 hypothetical protein AUC68_04740 [Methyloceanibacter methanicus]
MATLPPNPDGQNNRRAAFAETALAAYMRNNAVDPDSCLADLLCDLMHWSDRNDFNFADELLRAQGNYDAETASA